jgi:hypothetical protein
MADMKAWRLLPTTLTVTVAAVVLAGCGGGSSSGGRQLSKAAFIKQADAICTAGSKAQDRLPDPGSNGDLVRYVKRIYAIERGVVHDVRDLAAPAADRATIARMLDNVDRALALESVVEAAAGSGDQSQINDAQAGGAKYLNAAQVIASRYGFTACGV